MLGLPSRVVGRVERQPETGPEGVAEVGLNARNRFLVATARTEELGVLGEEPDTGRALDVPVAARPRDADLRLERPAIRADVDELARSYWPLGATSVRLAPSVVRGVRCAN